MIDGINPYLKRFNKKEKTSPAYRNAPKQEKKIAKRFGGRLTPRSGAGSTKGDVIVKGVLRVECKNTQKKSFSITLDMLDKIENATVANGEVPAIVVEFINDKGVKLKEVAVVPVWLLDSIVRNI